MSLFGAPNIESLEKKRDIKGLLKACENKNETNQRVAAINALGRIGDTNTIPSIGLLLKDDKKEIIKTAIKVLGSFNNQESLNLIIQALPGYSTNSFAIEELVSMGTSITPVLIQNLENDKDLLLESKLIIEKFETLDPFFQNSQNIESFNFQNINPSLIEQLGGFANLIPTMTRFNEANNVIRKKHQQITSLLTVLRRIGGLESLKVIISWTGEEVDLTISKFAIKEIEEWGDVETFLDLVELTKNSDRIIKSAAVKALIKTKDTQSINLIKSLIKNGDYLSLIIPALRNQENWIDISRSCIHDLYNCICVKCGRIMGNHLMHAKYTCSCSICGETIHDYQNCKCSRCGDVMHTWKDVTGPGFYSGKKCTVCGIEHEYERDYR